MGYCPPPQSKVAPPQIGNPQVLKLSNPPVSNFPHPPPLPTGNKKHDDVKLMHKPLTQHKLSTNKKNEI